MTLNWIISITSDEWNSFFEKNQTLEKSNKIAKGDGVCFYVRGTSSIKGVAKITKEDDLKFQKVGHLNYFGISDRLNFVKDKENVTKYLRNFQGVANIGKPIPKEDMELITSEISPEEISRDTKVEVAKKIGPEQVSVGGSHNVMYNLEVSLRVFIEKELRKISKSWMKERIPDPAMYERWAKRKEDARKQRIWFENEEPEMIEFADFYDLVTLIVNRANWKKCFEKVFGKQSIIESKMYELVPIRNKLAHNRTLTEEENMVLNLYSKQILRLMK